MKNLFAYLFFLWIFTVPPQLFSQENQREKTEIQKKETSKEKQSDFTTRTVEVPVNDSLYIVGPNDILTVAIFGTRYYVYDVQVSSNGIVLIPLLGELFIQNKTIFEVRKLIQSLIDKNFKDAKVSVNLAQARTIKVTVAGAVVKPGIIELPATGRVSEAIQQAGGFIKDTSAYRNIRVIRNEKDTLNVDLLAYLRIGDLTYNPFVMSGDVVYVPIKDEIVGIFGSVNKESRIDYVPHEKLFDLIKLAQGFKAEAFKDSVQIVRFQEDNITTKSFFLNLKDYPYDQSVNIYVQPSDLILVRGIPKYHYPRLVILKGEVKYPGSYPIEKDKTTLTEIIRRAGGFTKDASLEEAAVIRKQGANEIDKEFERLSKIPPADLRTDEYEYLKARSRERIGQMVVNFKRLFLENNLIEDIILREEDVVEIPERKNYIRIIGRALNPGNVIYNSNWKYKDYIQFVGGFGWRADDGDVRIIKARTGEILDADKESKYFLEPGDTIWVPEVPEVKFWTIAIQALGVLAQVAGILGIVIALTTLKK